jgi:hypothetical protein
MKQRFVEVLFATLVATGGLASVAHADDGEEAPAPEETSAAVSTETASSDGFTLPKGKLALNVNLGVNLSSDAVGKPVSLSPDLWYGVSDDLTIGLVHSGEGLNGFLGTSTGGSLCLAGEKNGCADVYHNVAVDVRYRLKSPLTLDAALYVNSFDPFTVGAKLGVDARWVWSKLSLEVRPSVTIGFNERDTAPGNHEALYVPATIAYAVAPKVGVGLQSGLAIYDLEHAGDTWAIPLSIAARFAATPKLGVGLAFSFMQLAAADAIGGGGADLRTLTLGGTYAF